MRLLRRKLLCHAAAALAIACRHVARPVEASVAGVRSLVNVCKKIDPSLAQKSRARRKRKVRFR